MKLNREQIIMALECWAKNFDGKVTDFKTLCEATLLINELTQANEQLSESYDHLEKTKDELLSERSRLCIELEAMRTAAYSYKKHNEKLTEQNKSLFDGLEIKVLPASELLRIMELEKQVERLVDENERLRADTVRSMRSRIKSRCIDGGIYPAFVERVIDQIAKEMMEGKI